MLQPSYIQYADNSSIQAASNLQTTDALFGASAEIVGGATSGAKGGCNISFDTFFDMEFNIPSFDFFSTSSDFDRSLFDKIDALSLEMSSINNMLIDSIVDMECCDIAGVYNGTVLPFFKFFSCSSGGGGGVMDVVIKMAEVITAIKAIVEALECLMPFLPGNPWLMKDVDYLSWIYGFWKNSGPVLDKFFSGEYIDMLLNPVHDVRKQLQSCLGAGGADTSGFENTSALGSSQQMQKLAAIAAKNGNQITQAQLLAPTPVIPPNAGDFRNGEGNAEYQKAYEAYETGKLAYETNTRLYKDVVKSVQDQTKIQENINTNLAIATQTQSLVKVSTDGICGCVADVLGLEDVSIIPFPTKTSQDMQDLVGRTISGLTNAAAGTSSKDRPKKELCTVQASDLQNPSTVDKILNSGKSKGKTEKATKGTQGKSKSCPYTVAGIPGGNEVIKQECVLIDYATLAGPSAIKDANDEKEGMQKDLRNLLTSVGAKTAQDREQYEKVWKAKQVIAKKILVDANASIGSVSDFSTRTQSILQDVGVYSDADLEVAQLIYENMFGTFVPFDLENDPEEIRLTSLWLTDDILDMMYTSVSSSTIPLSSIRTRAMNELPEDLRDIAFPPNTPPQNIINRLPVSTKVDINTKTDTNYFNAGFVRTGEAKWRNFNLLNLEYSDSTISMGAIARDRSLPKYAAVFPNDTIGDDANISYVKETYMNTLVSKIVEKELEEANQANQNEVNRILIEVYNYDTSLVIEKFSDEEIVNIMKTISDMNGYQAGDLWVRTKSVSDNVEFTTSYTNDNFSSMRSQNRLTTSEENALMNVAYSAASDPAKLMKKVNNDVLEVRAGAYAKEVKSYFQESAGHVAIDGLSQSINNSVASMVRTEVGILIPCTCDGLLCMVINMIIQKVLSAFQQMIDQIIATIMDFIIPDWIKDLMGLMQEYINCFMSVFGIPAKLKAVHKEAEQLRSDLSGRTNAYPIDTCFAPDSVTPGDALLGKQCGPETFKYVPGPCTIPNPCDTWGGSCPQTSSCSSPTVTVGSCMCSTAPQCGIGSPSACTICVTGACSINPGACGRSTPCLTGSCNYLDI